MITYDELKGKLNETVVVYFKVLLGKLSEAAEEARITCQPQFQPRLQNTNKKRAAWCSGNTVDFYTTDTCFESRPD
jgi:hypothetical protein